MDKISGFESPSLIGMDEEEPKAAAQGEAAVGTQELEEAQDANQDSLEEISSSQTWQKSADQIGAVIADVRKQIGPAETAIKGLSKLLKNPEGAQSEGALASVGRLSGSLAKLANAVGCTQAGLRLPEATRRLDATWNDYQHHPSIEAGKELKDAAEAWRKEVSALVRKIPQPAVAKQLNNLLEVASNVIGSFSVLVAARAKKAEDAANGYEPPAQAEEPQADPNPTIDDEALLAETEADEAVPAFENAPAEIDRKLGVWMSQNHLKELPPKVAEQRERALEIHAKLGEARDARSSLTNFFKRSELDGDIARLQNELGAALGQLELEARASKWGARDLILSNVKQSY
jgi:hypothetical protein